MQEIIISNHAMQRKEVKLFYFEIFTYFMFFSEKIQITKSKYYITTIYGILKHNFVIILFPASFLPPTYINDKNLF